MQKTIHYIIAIEDLLFIYIQTADNFPSLETDIDYLLTLNPDIEKCLTPLYSYIYNYFKYFKLAAQHVKKSINQLTEDDLEAYLKAKVDASENIFSTILGNMFTDIKTPGLIWIKTHSAVVIFFRQTIKSHEVFSKIKPGDTNPVNKYALTLIEFVFGDNLPQFNTGLNDTDIIQSLKQLAEANFLPAAHLLGCYLEDVQNKDEKKYKATESEKYLQQAIAGNYPLSKIYVAREYLKFTLNLDNETTIALKLPIENMDLTSIINFLREYIGLNFTSAQACKILFLQQLEQLAIAHNFVDRDLLGLARTLDRIETGKETSDIQSRDQVNSFITNLKTKLSKTKAASPQDKFYYLSLIGFEEISRLPKLDDEIQRFQSTLCSNIKSLLPLNLAQFFWTFKPNEQLILEYAVADNQQRLQEKFQHLHSIVSNKTAANIQIDKTLILVASLNAIAKAIQQALERWEIDDNAIRFMQTSFGSSHYYAMQVLVALVKYRKDLLLVQRENPEYKIPPELTRGIIFYLNSFLPYTERHNPYQGLENACLKLALEMLHNETETTKLHAEVLFNSLNKVFENHLTPLTAYEELSETVRIIHNLVLQLTQENQETDPIFLMLQNLEIYLKEETDATQVFKIPLSQP